MNLSVTNINIRYIEDGTNSIDSVVVSYSTYDGTGNSLNGTAKLTSDQFNTSNATGLTGIANFVQSALIGQLGGTAPTTPPAS